MTRDEIRQRLQQILDAHTEALAQLVIAMSAEDEGLRTNLARRQQHALTTALTATRTALRLLEQIEREGIDEGVQ